MGGGVEAVEEVDKRGWRGDFHLVKTRRLIARLPYHYQVHLFRALSAQRERLQVILGEGDCQHSLCTREEDP